MCKRLVEKVRVLPHHTRVTKTTLCETAPRIPLIFKNEYISHRDSCSILTMYKFTALGSSNVCLCKQQTKGSGIAEAAIVHSR